MRRSDYADLSECGEFRQTILATPPMLLHATAVLLILLLAAAICWAAVVEADLVVVATGRVRPVEEPARVFVDNASEFDARITEVLFEPGQSVRAGQTLVRLDTTQLDNRISQLERKISAAQEELAEHQALDRLLAIHLASAEAKAMAELAEAKAKIVLEKEDRESRIRAAVADLASAKDALARLEKLRANNHVSERDYVEAVTAVTQATERQRQAEITVDEGRISVLQQALTLVKDDFAVRRAEVLARSVAKQAEADSARKELENLQFQRLHCELKSPIDGVVVSTAMRSGDLLARGEAAIDIAPQDGFHFEVPVPSEDVGELQPGMPVKIKFDAFDHQNYGTLEGEVCFISPDSQVIEEGPHAGTVAYLVRMKLRSNSLERGDNLARVKLGLGGTAEIVTDRQTILSILSKKIRKTISLG